MKALRVAIRYLFIMTLLTGVIYPLFVTGFAKLLFPKQAEGSLIKNEEEALGSELIGQKFEKPKYFWSRPSAVDYNPMTSGGSNMGPSSRTLLEKFEDRKHELQVSSGNEKQDPPQDLLFASASGLDPHISPEAARYQVQRIAKSRDLSAEATVELTHLIESMTEDRSFGILGEQRVNVLKLNMALDR